MELPLRARVRAGDRAAFGALFDEHAGAVHRHAVRVTGNWAGCCRPRPTRACRRTATTCSGST